MYRLISGIFAVAAICLSVACGKSSYSGPAPDANAAVFPLGVTQSDGQKLVLQAAPKRIVSLSTPATETFCKLGAADQLAAVDKYANCPAGSKAKPEVDGFHPNLEAIAGFRPDLVYVDTDQDQIVASLRRLGVPVLNLAVPTSLSGVLDQIQLLGRITGRADKADAITAAMQARIDKIQTSLKDVSTGPRVYHELDDTFFSVGPHSFVGDLYTVLKAKNIAEGAATDYPQLSAEIIVARNPEVIVLADEGLAVTIKDVANRPGWSAIDAVKRGRICGVDPDLISRAGPRIVDGLDVLAKCLYPDRFK